LAAQIPGGSGSRSRGIVTPELVDTMEDAEVEELRARVEARLCEAKSKSFGSILLRPYATVVPTVLPLPPERQNALVKEFEEDPFV
jgi:hypothetical protein